MTLLLPFEALHASVLRSNLQSHMISSISSRDDFTESAWRP